MLAGEGGLREHASTPPLPLSPPSPTPILFPTSSLASISASTSTAEGVVVEVDAREETVGARVGGGGAQGLTPTAASFYLVPLLAPKLLLPLLKMAGKVVVEVVLLLEEQKDAGGFVWRGEDGVGEIGLAVVSLVRRATGVCVCVCVCTCVCVCVCVCV